MGLAAFAAYRIAMVVIMALAAGGMRPSVDIARQASLTAGGEAAVLSVRVRCAPGSTVLEAFVYVVQNDNQSAFASIPVTCNGRWVRSTVQVSGSGFQFHAGRARASGYLLLQAPDGTTYSLSPTQIIQLR
jgi:hypothetical protein